MQPTAACAANLKPPRREPKTNTNNAAHPSCTSLKVVIRSINPPLANLTDLLPQYRTSIPLGNFARRLDHPAGAIAHQLNDLQGPHAAVLALATLDGQVLQERLVDVELEPREGRALRVGTRGRVDHVLELCREDALEEVRLLELAGLRLVVLGFGRCVRVVLVYSGFGLWWFRGQGDGEVEFRKEGAREIGVLVAAFENDAVEFVVCYGDWVV
jgi:hypothetical protein